MEPVLRTMLSVYLFSILFFNFLHRYIFRISLSNVLSHSLRVPGSGISGQSSMELYSNLFWNIFTCHYKIKGHFPFSLDFSIWIRAVKGRATLIRYIWYRGVKIRTMGILSYTHFDSLGDFLYQFWKDQFPCVCYNFYSDQIYRNRIRCGVK